MLEKTNQTVSKKYERMPDAFTFMDGSKVNTKADWKKRKEEIATLYQQHMYGVWRSGEAVDYEELTEVVTGRFTATDWKDFSTWKYVETSEPATDWKKSLKIKLRRTDAGVPGQENAEAEFRVNLYLPCVASEAGNSEGTNDVVEKPEHPNGAPIFIEIGSLGEPVRNYLLSQGYAVAEMRTNEVASDDDKHLGAFYELYPYGKTAEEQTGVLMAWAWGVSKIIDVLSTPSLAEKWKLDPKVIIVNGVSRNGKATAVAGAFDPRITVTAPSSSGAGGVVAFRYNSEGLTFDYSPLRKDEFIDFQGEAEGTASYEGYQTEEGKLVTVTTNQSFTHLGHDSMGGWVIDNYRTFTDVADFPLDQHLLAALSSGKNRYLYITTEVVGGDWVNAAGTYACYLETKKIFERLGLEDHLTAHIHAVGHAFTRLDAEYLVAFCEQKVYKKEDSVYAERLQELATNVYEQAGNRDVFDCVYDKVCSDADSAKTVNC